MSEELKSCPFCGGRDIVILKPLFAITYCTECSAKGSPKNTKAEAITAWNTRAGEKA